MRKRLVWAEINLKNLTHNYEFLKKEVGKNVKVMAVLKANAYGHGLVPIASHLEKIGADFFGVACLYEAEKLRKAGIKTPILILGYSDGETAKEAVRQDISITVIDVNVLRIINNEAISLGKVAKVQIKVDTGMGRFGLLPSDAIVLIKKLKKYKHVISEGIFTHFATADEDDLSFAYHQLNVFNKLLDQIKSLNLLPPIIHAANSAAALRIAESRFNMVRPGILLTGYLPYRSSDSIKLKPILKLKTKIVQLKEIKKGNSVGYGRKFIASKDTLIATIPIGYGDGFRRTPNYGTVIINGKKVPVIGNVSMDQSTIDVSGIKTSKVGDEVIIIGKDQTVDDIAERLNTINYEVLTSISDRVERIYL